MSPFSSQIVSDPWQIEPPVAGLNEKPLERLLSIFSDLQENRRLERALVVVSPEPGYGKSHLIGRLFQRLQGKATRIYLRPFEAVDRCWQRILDRVVGELDRAEPLDSGHGAPLPRTQLDQIAAHTIGDLATDLIDMGLVKSGELPPPWNADLDHLRTLLRSDPLQLWEAADSQPWIDWISRGETFSCLEPGLGKREIRFRSVRNPLSWFKVLLAYLAHRGNSQRHRLCLDWLRGICFDPEEAAFLNIHAVDIPPAEISLEASNELAKERILDLCQLARFVRPFLFCFDQTEAFAQDPQRPAQFGYVVAELVDQAPNQMVVITANREVWEKKILPEIETAYRDRMCHTDRDLHLSGLNEDQARCLLERRLKDARADPEQAARFLKASWLPHFFSGGKTCGIRFFLQEAEKQWEKKPSETLPQCYERILAGLKQEPPLDDYDALQWLLREGGRSLPGWEVEDPYPGRKHHLLLRWKKSGQRVGFGLESGHNGKRWESIAREAEREGRDPAGCQRSIFVRFPDLPRVPGPRWKTVAETIHRACDGPMRICVLEEERWIRIAALYELHAKVLEGDLDFPREETLAFVREQLRPWTQEMVEGEKPPPKSGEGITLTVSELVTRCLAEGPAPSSRADLGTAFHKIVEEFTSQILREEQSPQTPEEYWIRLRDLAQREIAERRSRRGTREEAKFLEAALRAFHQNLKRVADSEDLSSWKDLFEGAEIPISGTFAGSGGRPIRVEGRLDTLRHHPKAGWQLVDYKLSPQSDSPRDLMQLAIYAELLRQSRKDFPFSGLLEYYNPSLTERGVSEAQLQAIFREQVLPLLEQGKGESPEEKKPDLPPEAKAIEKRLEEFFASHNFPVRCVGQLQGPQLIRFQLSCPPGVRIEKLLSLAPTLRVHLGLDGNPLISPVAGFVAVDLPNPRPFSLAWEEAKRAIPSTYELPLLVGRTIQGEILVTDLTDPNSPHVLVGGRSGSGKSVLLQCFLATLCDALPADRLEVLLIDPKILTFRDWERIPHLRERGLLTETDQALHCLEETVEEMDRRYRQLNDEGFDSLSQRMAAGKTEIPYRVILFDEFADWLLGARPVKQQFEKTLSRIAQKGRAAGIHLILATQRPERKVVTGLISANLSVRICLRVANATESQIVLGKGGGETLLGKGDLLCNLGPGGELIRAQAPFLESRPPTA
ncbi:DNA translocase FtsK [Verrucomicrobium sp. 3C]|uniref:DNA translocase FtsK n=1 Tax=Verrucomicrobium sp. 3C TaxID=1134055 RepID=UPI00037AE764|nr:DNA translocase FtsK [Verrucomicrobium sp. 3C]